MSIRKGTLLEDNVYRIFSLAGFNPKRNVNIKGYEVDVYIRYKDIELIIECKQYERSALSIRNILHEWDSKKKIIKSTKVLIVAIGVDISRKDYELARRFNIAIWDTDKFTRLMDEAISKKGKIKELLMAEIGIKLVPTSNEVKIKNLIRNYYCNRLQAEKYLGGMLKKDELKKIKQDYMAMIDKKKDILNKNDIQLLKNNKQYRNVPFRDIFRYMVKYHINDKIFARMLIVGNGGTYKGRRYNKRELQKMILVMDALDYTYDQVDKIDFNKYTIEQIRNNIKQLRDKDNYSYNAADWELLPINSSEKNYQKKHNMAESEKTKGNEDIKNVLSILLIISAIIFIGFVIYILRDLFYELIGIVLAIIAIILGFLWGWGRPR